MANSKEPFNFKAFSEDLDRIVAERVGVPFSMFHSGGVVGRRNDKIPFLRDSERMIPLSDPRIARESKMVTRPEFTTITVHNETPPTDNLVINAKVPSTPNFVQMLDDIERVERTPATQFREAYIANIKRIQTQIRNSMDRHLLNSTYGKLRR